MKHLIAVATVLVLASGSAQAVGVGVKGGTVGTGVELTLGLTETINARVSLTNYDIGSEDETFDVGDNNEGTVDAELDVSIGTSGLLFDWHVLGGGFHLTAGMMKNDASFDLSGTLVGNNIQVGGTLIDGSDLANGTVSGDISLGDSYQPYFGIGYGRRAGDGGGLTFTAELGVALLDPSASLEASLSGTAGITQQELDDALSDFESDVEGELDGFQLWPVITVGVNYAF